MPGRSVCRAELDGPLTAKLDELLSNHGSLSVAQFMEAVLHDADFGYYRTGNPLGHAGDFITSPDASPLFGEAIGLWVENAWKSLGQPSKFVLCEFGPGQGSLLANALRVVRRCPELSEAMTLRLLESNATLRKIQKRTLAIDDDYYVKDVGDLPKLPLVLMANEFFDTLPLRQFAKELFGWRERMVAKCDGELCFVEGPKRFRLPELQLSVLGPFGSGSVYEFSEQARSYMLAVARHISTFGGAGVIIDYGYHKAPGCSTLDALSNHKFVDVFTRPGAVDVTANVDFAALIEITRSDGLEVANLVTQKRFLEDRGLREQAASLASELGDDQCRQLAAGVRLLLADDALGSLKVMQFACAR